MKRESPRGPDGETLCEWCGGTVKQAGVGRRKRYCKAGCREMAYRARREAEIKLVAYSRGRADAARTVSSTGETRSRPEPSVDETDSSVDEMRSPAVSPPRQPVAPPAPPAAPRRPAVREPRRSPLAGMSPGELFQLPVDDE